MFGRRLRTNYEPARQVANNDQTAVRGSDQLEQPTRLEQQLSPFRGPYKLHDLVRVRLPHVPKGSTPFSKPRRVTAVLGHYTYRLDDGQAWNARRLVRVHRAPRAIEVGGEEEPRGHGRGRGRERHVQRLPRRSERPTRGKLPIRYGYPWSF